MQSRDRGPKTEIAAVVIGSQEPRIRSVPPYVSTIGNVARELAASCGLVLDQWQTDMLVDSLGCREDGKFAAFEIGLNVARQNGKGGALEARELTSIELLGDKLVIHSSHEFATSMVAMNRMEELLEEGSLISELRPRGGISRSHGSEGFVFKTGQRIWYRTRTKGGGRGFSADLVILDEAMILQEMFIGALLPTMSARSITGNPQVWYTGSAVDQMVHEHGIVFARLRERGLRGNDPSLAYFEHSADPGVNHEGVEVTLNDVGSALLDSETAWAQANPGLGIRISGEHIAKELRSMDPRTFAVERLGIGDWPETDPTGRSVIDVEQWKALIDPKSFAVDPVCFAFDVKPDRASSSIAVCGLRPDGLPHLEVIDHGPGTGWVVDRLVELVAIHRSSGVACDGASPAASLVPELEQAGVSVKVATAREHAAACGGVFDAVQQGGVRHLGTPDLTAAVKAATKRTLGDAWAWSRKGGVDISPLVAVTLALWAHSTLTVKATARAVDLSTV